jgi:citrate lyase subunit beta / citryl-CoA lyase
VTSETDEPAGIQRPPLRSLLFLPGTRTKWLAKAEATGADAAILDLEETVPSQDKHAARARVAEALAHRADGSAATGGMAIFVRINSLDAWSSVEELRAVARPGLAGLVLPKVQVEQELRTADRLLTWCESEHGLPPGSIALVPLLETERALRDVPGILAASSRIAYAGALTEPGGDVERALGYRPNRKGTETFALRSHVLRDVQAAGTPQPVTGLWTRGDDLPGLRRFAEQNRALGYTGMMTSHPSHISVLNEVFSADFAELARAERMIAALRQAQAQGASSVNFDGQMVDENMAAGAQRMLKEHRRRRTRTGEGSNTHSL